MRATGHLLASIGLFGLVACAPTGATAPPPATFDARIAVASTDPVWVERVDDGTFLALTARVMPPAHVSADPVARADWFLAEIAGAEIGVVDPATDLDVTDVQHGAAGTPEEGDALVTYARWVEGVPVWGSSVRVEVAADGAVVVLVAQTPSSVDVSTVPTVPRDEAIRISRGDDEGATVVAADLFVLNEAMLEGEAGPSRLVWLVKLSSGLDAPHRFVDAHSAELLELETTGHLEGRHRLTSTASLTCDPHILLLALQETGSVLGGVPTADATTAHRHAGEVWDYFFRTFGRDSHDGRGARVITGTDLRRADHPPRRGCTRSSECTVTSGCRLTARCAPRRRGEPNECLYEPRRATQCGIATQYCDASSGCTACGALQNAFWDGTGMYFGEGMATLDVVGHEYTHGVVAATAGLVYRGQAGALDESFADVFGQAIRGSGYTIGVGTPIGGFRDMQQPGRFTYDLCNGGSCPRPYPDHVDDRYTGRRDYGGVHVNSSIMNHAAYLATEGGVHRNDTEPVRGIGTEKVQQIWFRALTWYMTRGSTFQGAKIALRLAAWKFAQREMHGVTYEDCGSVLNALGAVGVGGRDADYDCHTDSTDNCPYAYNPLQDEVEGCRCGDRTMCEGCTLEPACFFCRAETEGGADRCMSRADRDSCRGQAVESYDMCSDECGAVGGPCSGSGPSYDDECCEGLICVVGACQRPAKREREACLLGEGCARGLDCRPRGAVVGASQCCARPDFFCVGSEDCCGLMECVDGQCRARQSGESCTGGFECVGASYCELRVEPDDTVVGTCT